MWEEFGILGPVQVLRHGEPVAVGGQQTRRILAALLLNANRLVTTDALVDATWSATPPRHARVQVQNRLSGLRKVLRSGTGPDADLIATVGCGYLIRLADGQLDLDRFLRRCARSDELAAAGDLAGAADELAAALRLWRGAALADLSTPALTAAAHRLDEQRLTARERHAELCLALGRHREVASELGQLADEHPYRENLHGLLMRALHQSGRQADAFQVFRRLRRRLTTQLGVEPGAELRGLHEAMLRGEAGGPTAPTRPRPVSAAPGRPADEVPRQLPIAVAGFIGRADQLARLDGLLDGGAAGSAIAVVTGTAGVGKTALAVHWAHRVADRFPDGQLYVNLRGFDITGSPVGAADAVRGFLDALGVAPERVPASATAQAARYRSLLAGRRMLVVLDNARDVEQIRSLLPGSTGCLTVVTSRNRLSGLVAAAGARLVTVGPMHPEEAHQLLAHRLGTDRVATEPAARDEIIASCGGLPLALAVVAARAAAHPGFPLQALAAELRATRGGLDAFTVDEPDGDVRTVFSWSYQRLSPAAARLFRLLAGHPGPDFSGPAVASLAGVPLPPCKALLAELGRANLITEHAPGRYALHDLLAAYANELTHAVDDATDRRAAHRRLLDHYLHTAYRAAVLLYPHRIPITLAGAGAGVTPERIGDLEQALAWFGDEHPVLVAAVRQAAASGLLDHTWQLAWTLTDFLDRRGHWADFVATHQTALRAAAGPPTPLGRAHTHRGLGRVLVRLGRHDEAHTHLRHALALFDQLGDLPGQANTHLGIAWVCQRQGRHRDALAHAGQALEVYQVTADAAGQARALNAVGWYHARLGNHEQTLAHCLLALPLQRKIGDLRGQADTLDSIGYAHHHLGRHDRARPYYRAALALYRALGDRYYEADTLIHLGDADYGAGRPPVARQRWQQALAILDRLGHPDADTVRTRLRAVAARPDIPQGIDQTGHIPWITVPHVG